MLQIGDYTIAGLEKEVAVERKSIDDLANCLGRDRERFVRQLQKGRGLNAYAVVCEGSWLDLVNGNYRSRLAAHSACQSVTSFMSRWGVQFLFAGNRKAAEYACFSYLLQYAQGIRRRLRAVEAAMDPLRAPKVLPSARVVCMAGPVEM